MPDWKASSFASRQLGHLYYIRPFDLDPSRKNGGEGFLRNEDTLCVARFIWLNGLDEFNGHRIWKCPFTNTLVHSLFLLGKMNELLVNGGGGCMLSIRTERIYTTWSWSVLRTIELWRVPRLNAFYTIYIYISCFSVSCICSIIMNVDSRIASRLWKYNSALTRNQ